MILQTHVWTFHVELYCNNYSVLIDFFIYILYMLVYVRIVTVKCAPLISGRSDSVSFFSLTPDL